MNKSLIITSLLLLFCISIVNAKIVNVDKKIIEVDDCYNLTVHYTQTGGNASPIKFLSCKDLGDNTWFCDCKNSGRTYNLTMQSDGTILNKPRVYDFNIQYRTYEITKFSDSFTLKDYGYDVSTSGLETEELGRDIETVYNTVYVNRTVYVERNKTVEVPKYVNVYVDNQTKLDALYSNISNLQWDNAYYDKRVHKLKFWRNTFIIMFSLTLLFALYIHMMWRAQQ